jgi:hypothetical protein
MFGEEMNPINFRAKKTNHDEYSVNSINPERMKVISANIFYMSTILDHLLFQKRFEFFRSFFKLLIFLIGFSIFVPLVR